MRLYALVTSDRASKGQGGNKYICIKLTVQNGIKQDYPIGELILDYKDDQKEHGTTQNEWVLSYLAQTKSDAEIIDQGNVEPPTKGKQQKGEGINGCIYDHIHGDGSRCDYHNI